MTDERSSLALMNKRFRSSRIQDVFVEPCHMTPRQATEAEIGDLYDFFEVSFDMARSDAQGTVDCCSIAVFDDGYFLLPSFSGKVIVVLMGGKPNQVFIFTGYEGNLRLVRRYIED